ncbi:MAG: hypothetical protein JNL11_09570 [Bdellovibrionaceae bacterium]|nr:hypothetical protein [Pseudobdellovibrionaceae bacterium]
MKLSSCFFLLLSFFVGPSMVWAKASCVQFYNEKINHRPSMNKDLQVSTADINRIVQMIFLKMRADQSIDSIFHELISTLKSAANVQNEQAYTRAISEIGDSSVVENETANRLNSYFERMKTITHLVSKLKSDSEKPKLWGSKNGANLDIRKIEEIQQLFQTIKADRKHFLERKPHIEKLATQYSDHYPIIQTLEASSNLYLSLLINVRERMLEPSTHLGVNLDVNLHRKLNMLHGLLSTPIEGLQMRSNNLRLLLESLEGRAAQMAQIESILAYQGNTPIEDVYTAGGFTLAESQAIAESYRKYQIQVTEKEANSLKVKWANLKQNSMKFKKMAIGLGIAGLVSSPIIGVNMHNQKIEDTFNAHAVKVVQAEGSKAAPDLKYLVEHSPDFNSFKAGLERDSVIASLKKADIIFLARSAKFYNTDADIYIFDKIFQQAKVESPFSTQEASELRQAILNRPGYQKTFGLGQDDLNTPITLLEEFIRASDKGISIAENLTQERGEHGVDKISFKGYNSSYRRNAIEEITKPITSESSRDSKIIQLIVTHSGDLTTSDAIDLAKKIRSEGRRDALLLRFK